MKTLWCLLALLLAVPRPVAAACPATPGRSGPMDVTVGSVVRTFVLRIPSQYDGRTPAPVVIAFHPGGSNPQFMQARFNVASIWPEALALYPVGMGRSSEADSRPSWQTQKGQLDDRDLAFFDAMRAWMRDNHCIDDKRVFVVGYSNGAMLSSVLACERPTGVAGFALAAGSATCAPAAAAPVIISHGLADQSVSYARGVAMAQEWATRNSCKAPPATGAVGCAAAPSCSAPVVFCTHPGGHEYDLQFTKEIVAMFKSAVKP